MSTTLPVQHVCLECMTMWLQATQGLLERLYLGMFDNYLLRHG